MSEKLAVTRRRLLAGVVAAGVAGAGAGAGTMAYFEDSETSDGNTVQAGTLNLEFGGGGSFSFNAALAPTQSTTGTVTLVGNDSLSGSLDVDVSYTENDAAGNQTDVTADQLASNLLVETLTYGGTDLTGQVSASGPEPTLQELATNDQTSGETTGNDLIDLQDPGAGTDFVMGLRLADVGNQYQRDGLTVDVTFHLNQTDDQ